jgi:hypothetical protein
MQGEGRKMKKIPTLFKRVFEGHRIKEVLPEVTPGMEWVLEGKGTATIKIDGSCVGWHKGKWYKRYDAKHGKKPPEGAIPCCEPDPVTGHWPHWVQIDMINTKPEDKWYVHAILRWVRSLPYDRQAVMARNMPEEFLTYEAVGPHFNGNPYGMEDDTLFRHGECRPVAYGADVERTFDGIRKWLEEHEEEGLVFWLDGEPRCKIKRTDFGLEWPVKGEKHED